MWILLCWAFHVKLSFCSYISWSRLPLTALGSFLFPRVHDLAVCFHFLLFPFLPFLPFFFCSVLIPFLFSFNSISAISPHCRTIFSEADLSWKKSQRIPCLQLASPVLASVPGAPWHLDWLKTPLPPGMLDRQHLPCLCSSSLVPSLN